MAKRYSTEAARNRNERAGRTDRASRATRSERSGRRERNARSERAGRAERADRTERAKRTARSESAERVERSNRKRRQRTKERAGKMYERQYAAEQKREDAAHEEGAPRAALYKGQMGSSQRRSARMQRSSVAGSASAKINPAGWLNNLNVTPRSLKVGTAVLCVVLLFAFLYAPAQQYYQAQRENSRLVAEYAVLEQRNSALDAQNDTLASDAGMEDAVRQKYGYIVQGEQTAVVSGLSDRVVGTALAADNSDIEANVLSSTVKAPEEWYTPFLDAFFFYE